MRETQSVSLQSGPVVTPSHLLRICPSLALLPIVDLCFLHALTFTPLIKPPDASSRGYRLLWKRDQDAVVLVLKERLYLVKLEEKVAKSVRQCKHFKGPRLIPQAYGPLLTPTKPNEVVEWDFLSLGEGFGDSSYLLVVKDDLSHFCELFACATPTAYVAAEALTRWYARLKEELNFTPVFSPWLNGTVERLNKDVLQALRALLMKYGLDQHEWPYLIPACQANLNHTRVKSLPGRAPVGVFTALPASLVLDAIVMPARDERDESVVDLTNIDEHVNRIRSLHAILQEGMDVKERRRLRDMAAHKGSRANFDVGDFMLWPRVDQRLPNRKLLGHWVGPFKVVAALPHSFEIEHLVTGRKYAVHASRFKFYADAELNTTTELLELASIQSLLLGVETFLNHRFNREFDRWELFVSWLGLQNIENSWEPLSTPLQDVHVKVRDY
ncbi:hypothetical protein PC110_g9486 [Phytophthora cactorum]|uniref:Chromo domain-containing protein n=1 Tax=Phytophthora cactorum TaxID=29920 RepID=A0A329SF80_9STRA|nr:hypothetical protein PC110_g9486 [Phytophthora cactorum]